MSFKRKLHYLPSRENINMGAKQSNTASVPHQTPKRNKRGHSKQTASIPQLPRYSEHKVQAETPSPSPPRIQFNEHDCNLWFDQYADPDTPDMIGPEGTERFLQDLGLSVENILVIVIAWKMNAASMGYISRAEWETGMRALCADTAEKLKSRLSELENCLTDPLEAREIYRYLFLYAKNKDQKVMDVDIAIVLWPMILGDKYPLVQDFVTFMQEQRPVKAINKDQWQSFYEFVSTVSPDLSDYDETSAWPVLFDEFVEWRKKSDGAL